MPKNQIAWSCFLEMKLWGSTEVLLNCYESIYCALRLVFMVVHSEGQLVFSELLFHCESCIAYFYRMRKASVFILHFDVYKAECRLIFSALILKTDLEEKLFAVRNEFMCAIYNGVAAACIGTRLILINTTKKKKVDTTAKNISKGNIW